MTQEERGTGTTPLRIRGWEMLADIACAQRSQHRIGQGVKPDIRVGMAVQALVTRYHDAAQTHMVAGPEEMNVEAGADPKFALGRGSTTSTEEGRVGKRVGGGE